LAGVYGWIDKALNGIWPLERERETNHYILEIGLFWGESQGLYSDQTRKSVGSGKRNTPKRYKP
jgi:hypothetical protein